MISLSPRDIERFEALYMPEPNSGCWLWLGPLNGKNDQHGRLRVGDKVLVAHRVSYELTGRVIPPGLVLDHTCCNPTCVNPDHLEPVTNGENVSRFFRRMTFCLKGLHPRTQESTFLKANGRRHCRECNDVASKARRAA